MTDSPTDDPIPLTITPSITPFEPDQALDSVPESAPISTPITPTPEDTLSRLTRAAQFRETRRRRASMVVPALLLIGIGILLLIKPAELSPAWIAGVISGAIGIALFARFVLNGARERGLAFLSLLMLLWLACAAVFVSNFVSIGQGWPLFVIAIGAALFGTFALERSHDRGVLLPGLVCLWAGAVALIFTLQLISAEALGSVAGLWPFAFVLIALALIPRVFRVG